MSFTDEKLSAFLDGELDSVEMSEVREAIANDIAISDRLAALAEVDMVVKAAAEKATAVALPKEIVALLSDKNTEGNENENTASNVTPIDSATQKNSLAPKRDTKWKGPFAIAASVAVLAGLVFFTQQSADTTQPSHWAKVSSVLDSNLAGEGTTFESGVTVTPQLSFLNTEFNYCRQAEVASKDELNVMIACKDNQGAWQLTASKLDSRGEYDGQYQTASSAKLMEDELDKMMASAPLNREQEKDAIEATWQSKKAKGVNDEN